MNNKAQRGAKIQSKILSADDDRFMVALDQSNESADSVVQNASNLGRKLKI